MLLIGKEGFVPLVSLAIALRLCLCVCFADRTSQCDGAIDKQHGIGTLHAQIICFDSLIKGGGGELWAAGMVPS